MMLSLTSIDQQLQYRKFYCTVPNFEFALDVASRISSKSHQLINVTVIDEVDSKMSLPVEVFDGDSFTEPIQQLEAQWQRVLSKPVNHQAVHTQWLIDLARQHITFQQNRIGNLEDAIRHINQHWPPLEKMEKTTSYASRRVSQFKTQLDRYQRQLASAQLNLRIAVNRLEEYQTRR